MQTRWPLIVLASMVAVYLAYALMAPYTLANVPPIPSKVLTESGNVMFTGEDIVQGKYLFQKYGLMDYGSILGMGGYYGIDFTSYTLEIIKESIATSYGTVNASVLDSATISLLKADMQPTYDPKANSITITDRFAQGFNQSILFYQDYFGPQSSRVGLKLNLITDSAEIKQITSFFTWSGLISLMGYTNGFPYIPGIQEPSGNVTYASLLQMTALLLAIMPVAAYVISKLLSHWNEPVLSIQLPKITSGRKPQSSA